MDWFSSDWHLGHENIIRICDRPFSSVEEMDKTIMGNMLSVMKRKDTLYFLGDCLSHSQ
jgi:calcineurin-like phosphoesterase family protein